MQTRIAGFLCACALSAVASSEASAQLVVGSTTAATTNAAAVYVDVTSGATTTLWNATSNTNVNGLAGNDAGGKLYSNDAARLNVWNYGSPGTQPTFIAGVYRTDGLGTFQAVLNLDGLCWANGTLYGSIDSSSNATIAQNRGIYSVNTTSDGMPTPHCVASPIWTNTNGSMNLGGLDFDPSLGASGKFVCTSTFDATSTGGPGVGLYSIDALGAGAVTKIADFPAGQLDWDGLAIGGGKYWLTDWEVTGGSSILKIQPYNPTTGLYESMITIGFADATNRGTAAAWVSPSAVPEPTSLALIALVGAAMTRRRSR